METWAHCALCDRWYYCAGHVIEDTAAATCPVCCTAPDRFEERAPALFEPISVD